MQVLYPSKRCANELGSQSVARPTAQLTVSMHARVPLCRFRVLRKLGEGGYSYVFLVQQVEDKDGVGQQFALKKVLAGTRQQLEEAQHEVDVMQQLRHPNILPVLDHSVSRVESEGGATHVVYMLFPLYQVGMGGFGG